jgi:Flp pilus assembly CpaF family ATPase
MRTGHWGIHTIHSACPSQSLSHKLTMMEKCKYISCLLLGERLGKIVNVLLHKGKTQTTAIIVIWGKITA